MTKRFNIITAIVVCVLLAAFGLAIAWICINKDVLVSGSKIYTQEQYEEYGEKRYQDGLEQNKTAEELMKKYKSELENEQTAHLKTKAELQKEKEKTNQDQARIAELEARLAAQEETLTRLSGLIESYEEIKNGTYELSFKVDGKLYKTIAVVKNGNVKNLPNDPQKEGCAFEGWVEEGNETLVDFTTYTATKDTTFLAKFKSWQNILTKNQLVSETYSETFKLTFSVEGLKTTDIFKVTIDNPALDMFFSVHQKYYYNSTENEWQKKVTDKYVWTIQNNHSETISDKNEVTLTCEFKCLEDGVLTLEYSYSGKIKDYLNGVTIFSWEPVGIYFYITQIEVYK